MPLTASIRASITAQLSKTLDLSSPSAQPALSVLAALTNGTLNTEADRVFADTRTLAASATEDLDFGTAGGLKDDMGDPFEPVEIAALMVTAAVGNTNNVVMGNAAAEAFLGPFGAATHTLAVKPGACMLWFAPAGWPSLNNASDKLKFLNGGAGTPVTYSIIALGRSA